MRALVEKQLNALTAKPIDEVRKLPDFSTVDAPADGGVIKLTTYHESLENDVHRVIVQAVAPKWFGLINAVIAEGYEITVAGGLRRLTPQELYTYI